LCLCLFIALRRFLMIELNGTHPSFPSISTGRARPDARRAVAPPRAAPCHGGLYRLARQFGYHDHAAARAGTGPAGPRVPGAQVTHGPDRL
jgi:hypothetical protein